MDNGENYDDDVVEEVNTEDEESTNDEDEISLAALKEHVSEVPGFFKRWSVYRDYIWYIKNQRLKKTEKTAQLIACARENYKLIDDLFDSIKQKGPRDTRPYLMLDGSMINGSGAIREEVRRALFYVGEGRGKISSIVVQDQARIIKFKNGCKSTESEHRTWDQ